METYLHDAHACAVLVDEFLLRSAHDPLGQACWAGREVTDGAITRGRGLDNRMRSHFQRRGMWGERKEQVWGAEFEVDYVGLAVDGKRTKRKVGGRNINEMGARMRFTATAKELFVITLENET